MALQLLPQPIHFISPSPSVRPIATSAEESHPLSSVAPLATILNDVFTFSVGGAVLKASLSLCIQCNSRDLSVGFIVVQWYPQGARTGSLHFFSPSFDPGRKCLATCSLAQAVSQAQPAAEGKGEASVVQRIEQKQGRALRSRRRFNSDETVAAIVFALGLSFHESAPMTCGDHFFAFTFFGEDQTQFECFCSSLTLRSGQAILRYYPRLLSSWPTSSTDAPRLWSIPEAVESSFPLRLLPRLCCQFPLRCGQPDLEFVSRLRTAAVLRSSRLAIAVVLSPDRRQIA